MTKRSESSRSAAAATTRSGSTSIARSATAEELDALHDAGGDLEPFMDTAQARRPGREVQRVNVDFPLDLLAAIDREVHRIGVTRQAFIKMRLADSLASAGSTPTLMEELRKEMATISANAEAFLKEEARKAATHHTRRRKRA
jgi:hypothetical protein